MKLKIFKSLALVLSLVCILCFPVSASAASQGTEGTEMDVIQPESLVIQLGESWAGVEFELKTDTGMYPAPVIVGEDGILRLEIGGSTSYILSCLNSDVSAPVPAETLDTEASIPTEETEDPTTPAESTEPTESKGEIIISNEEDAGQNAGIPTAHIVLFVVGLIVAVGALVGIWYFQSHHSGADDCDENDEF